LYSFYQDLQQLVLELHTIRVVPQRGDCQGQVDAIDPLSFGLAKWEMTFNLDSQLQGILIETEPTLDQYQNVQLKILFKKSCCTN
jgi:hypothetical protein